MHWAVNKSIQQINVSPYFCENASAIFHCSNFKNLTFMKWFFKKKNIMRSPTGLMSPPNKTEEIKFWQAPMIFVHSCQMSSSPSFLYSFSFLFEVFAKLEIRSHYCRHNVVRCCAHWLMYSVGCYIWCGAISRLQNIDLLYSSPLPRQHTPYIWSIKKKWKKWERNIF